MWKVSSIMEMILPCREVLLEYKGKKNLGSAKFCFDGKHIAYTFHRKLIAIVEFLCSESFAVKCGFYSYALWKNPHLLPLSLLL
jgi:hypothetical protein